MSFSEQADYSAEHADEPRVYDKVRLEQCAIGSMAGYLDILDAQYSETNEGRAALAQLQRMARSITNPLREDDFPHNFTDAFYWGEILAYRVMEVQNGDMWMDNSYKLFSEEIVATAKKYRDEAETDRMALLRASTERLGELEESTDGVMVPEVLAELIDEWADMTTHHPVEQSFMVFGYRHIVIQAMQRAAEDKITQDQIQAGRAAAFRAKLENSAAFADIMTEGGIAPDGFAFGDEVIDEGPETESIDDVRERIMESYADHMVAYGAIDLTNDDKLNDAAAYLSDVMNRDFVGMEGIEGGDVIECTGNVFFVLSDTQGHDYEFIQCEEGDVLKGAAQSIAIATVPTVEMMEGLKAAEFEGTVFPSNPLGVVMVLDEFVHIRNGEVVAYKPGSSAGVVLSNSNMHIKKYLA